MTCQYEPRIIFSVKPKLTEISYYVLITRIKKALQNFKQAWTCKKYKKKAEMTTHKKTTLVYYGKERWRKRKTRRLPYIYCIPHAADVHVGQSSCLSWEYTHTNIVGFKIEQAFFLISGWDRRKEILHAWIRTQDQFKPAPLLTARSVALKVSGTECYGTTSVLQHSSISFSGLVVYRVLPYSMDKILNFFKGRKKLTTFCSHPCSLSEHACNE